MKLYFAAPLFTSAERAFNKALAARLEAGGHQVFLPQERGPLDDSGQADRGEGSTPRARSMSPRQIFEKNLRGLDWAEGVVAIMDGPDPDSGTAWECGYAHARGKPTVLLRTDFRGVGDAGESPYNAMLSGSTDARVEIALASIDEAAAAILEALGKSPPG
ncbi:MAG TPA: nucleoside 2-deoxyribosyltransferase [Candidatus Deferrimicrobiaceae bacterium]|nr:nucleoside 2-deoxyribosyltransferase [Candidatus Deferrimicrobiaceae bacterium]